MDVGGQFWGFSFLFSRKACVPNGDSRLFGKAGKTAAGRGSGSTICGPVLGLRLSTHTT